MQFAGSRGATGNSRPRMSQKRTQQYNSTPPKGTLKSWLNSPTQVVPYLASVCLYLLFIKKQEACPATLARDNMEVGSAYGYKWSDGVPFFRFGYIKEIVQIYSHTSQKEGKQKHSGNFFPSVL